MPDILITGVPDEVVNAIDTKARSAGLSRTEYLRRALTLEGGVDSPSVSVDDLTQFAETFADLASDEVMGGAWE